jgi:hypothetical protein
VWAFQARPAGQVLSAALTYLGNFVWLNQYQTLITGIAAAGAVVFQIRQAERLENDRFLAKRASAQAVLPLTLSDVMAYLTEMAKKLDDTRDQCVNGVLPRPAKLPDFPYPSEKAISELGRMVEHSFASERVFVSRLVSVMQVLRSRVDGMVAGNTGDELTFDMNIETMMVDCAEIYARTSALYKFGRGIDRMMPDSIKTSDITLALLQLSLEGSLSAHTMEAYGLGEERRFERWMPAGD